MSALELQRPARIKPRARSLTMEARRKPPQLADIKVPKVNGFEVLRQMHANPIPADLRCVLLRSSAEERGVQWAVLNRPPTAKQSSGSPAAVT